MRQRCGGSPRVCAVEWVGPAAGVCGARAAHMPPACRPTHRSSVLCGTKAIPTRRQLTAGDGSCVCATQNRVPRSHHHCIPGKETMVTHTCSSPRGRCGHRRERTATQWGNCRGRGMGLATTGGQEEISLQVPRAQRDWSALPYVPYCRSRGPR